MVGTKGWYIKQLKAMGVTQFEGRKLETYKAHVVAGLYHKKIAN